jgi:hypothetical protein
MGCIIETDLKNILLNILIRRNIKKILKKNQKNVNARFGVGLDKLK